MIQIYRDFDDLAEWHRERIIEYFGIDDLLESKIQEDGTAWDNFLKFIRSNLDNIIEGNPVFLERHIIREIEVILGNDFFTKKEIRTGRGKRKRANKVFIDELNTIFDYTSFSNSSKSYSAYDLTKKLDVSVCPYCNRNYISTLEPDSAQKKGGTRPTLDHFYLKSDYPYLALSFWNLIPSCYSCNTQFRSTRSFDIFSNSHPYLNDFEGIYHFETDIDDIEEYIGRTDKSFQLILTENSKLKGRKSKVNRAKNNVEVFRIDELYDIYHKEDAKEIIQKTIVYDEGYSASLFHIWDGLFEDEFDAQKMVLGNFTDPQMYEKRPLSKLTRDIVRDMELI